MSQNENRCPKAKLVAPTLQCTSKARHPQKQLSLLKKQSSGLTRILVPTFGTDQSVQKMQLLGPTMQSSGSNKRLPKGTVYFFSIKIRFAHVRMHTLLTE